MSRTGFILCMFVLVAQKTWSDDQGALDGRVISLALDQGNPALINVGIKNITTVELPARIEAIEGYGFFLPTAQNGASGEGNLFQISCNKGSNFFSIRALKQSATGNLNVVVEKRVYCLFFQESPEPSFVVTFIPAGGGGGVEKTAANGSDNSGSGPVPEKKASPERLGGLLDKAKGFMTLRNSAPEMYEGIAFAEPNKKADIDQDISTTIRRVLRDDAIDSVAFEVEITNRSKQDFFYDPEGFGARVGQKLFSESIGDASGVVPPGRSEIIYFCVTGDGKGGRNDLAVSNDFDIAVRKIQGRQTTPIGWTEPPDTLPGSKPATLSKASGHKSGKGRKLVSSQ